MVFLLISLSVISEASVTKNIARTSGDNLSGGTAKVVIRRCKEFLNSKR